jgi:DNA-binding transcriptional LysR family regulator
MGSITRMITLRQLEIFAAVIEYGSFRRCAEMLSISQGAISEHIRTLETQLGVELFERVKGGTLQLTDAGQRAKCGVKDLLAHAHDFVETVVGEADQSTPLRIAMHGFMLRNLDKVMASWGEGQSQELKLQSDERHPKVLADRVAARDFHAAYFYSFQGIGDPGEVVGHEQLGIFVSETHPLTRLDLVKVADLVSQPVVGLSTDKPLRHLIGHVLSEIGIHHPRHAIETGEFGLILSSLHRNLGYCCMFLGMQAEAMQTQGLVALPMEQTLPSLQIKRVIRRNGFQNSSLSRAISAIEANAIAPYSVFGRSSGVPNN